MPIRARVWLRELAGSVRRNALLLAVYAAFGAILAIRAGQDVNWDLLNYHFYDPFQLFAGRLDRNLDVAGIQTFMNPFFDVPFFVGVFLLRLPPIVVGASLGAFHGLSLFFVHKIMLALLTGSPRPAAHALGALAAIVSAYGAGFQSEVGGTMGDATLSVFVVGAVWMLVSRAGRDGVPTWRAVAWAGVLIGLAMGKLVSATYLAGLGIAVVLLGGSIKRRLIRGTTLGALVLCGAAISVGYWAWTMQVHYGNPGFPYFSASRLTDRPARPALKQSMLPRIIVAKTLSPFFVALTPKRLWVSEISFRDGRLLTACGGIALFGLVAGARAVTRRRALRTVADGRTLTLIVCVGCSLVVWLVIMTVYRYGMPIELLSSTVALGSLVYVFRSSLRAALVMAPVCVYLFVTSQPLDWGRSDWQSSYFGMDNVNLIQYDGATILLWEMPNGYLVPYFPKSTTFVRLQSNWTRERTMPELARNIEIAVQGANREKIYLLETIPGASLDKKEDALERLGLTLDLSACREFSSAFDPVRICAARYLDK